jgi:S1-C subfamily serine protease
MAAVHRLFRWRPYVGLMRAVLLSAVVAGLVSVAVVLLLRHDEDDPPAAPTQTAVPARELSARELYERSRRAIVRVDARPPGTPIPKGRPTRDDGVATGSGFAVSRDGEIVTNDHVVSGGSIVSVQFRDRGKRFRARVVERERSKDLALLKISRRTTPLPLAADAPRVGDPVIALGNPFGLDRTLTVGVVSGVGRRIDAPDGSPIRDAIQTDAAIAPGSSGGPLLDAEGRVIGVNSQSEGPGLGFAVPVGSVRKLL